MTKPLSPAALVKALRAEGVTVVEHDGWTSHNRAGHGPWGPVNGVIVHHTVTEGTDHTVRQCWDGYDDLPGPLCHGVIDKAGTVHLIGNGRTNHAGRGDHNVLTAVTAEDYENTPPHPTANNTDGNVHFYGFECINLGDGKDPWPDAQLDAIERASAAICRAHGWTARSVIGHKEWTNTKIDPRGFAMPDMRDRIAVRLRAKPAGGSTTAHTAKPKHQPFPGAAWFTSNPRSPVITAMGRRLVAEGCSAYAKGPGPEWTEADRRSYRCWQRKRGYTGADADGWPGKTTWDALKVPYTA